MFRSLPPAEMEANNIGGKVSMKDISVPIWQKSNLTLDEAAAYSGIGKNTMRNLCNAEDCDFVLWIGAKRLIKRQKLDEYLANHTRIER